MKKRETELDILRLIAMLAVIFTHASGIEVAELSSSYVTTFLTATITWHVPIFVMLSGRFFLDPDRSQSPKKLWLAIRRLLVAFLIWNLVYQMFYICTNAYAGLNWKGILSQALIGPYHFWYLFMLMGLYAIVPFLRKITENKQLSEYFIVLFLMFSFLTTYGSSLPLVGTTLNEILSKTNFHLALGFSGYYVLGYYLHRYPLSKKKESVLYLLGITMVIFTGLATIWKTTSGAPGKEWFSKYLMPNVVVEAAAIYTFFVNRISRIHFKPRCHSMISRLAQCCFGIYLLHALILDVFTKVGFSRLPISPIVLSLLTTICAFIVSATLIAFIRKIPCLGEKIT